MGLLSNCKRPVVICSGQGAKQEFKDECDINVIMNRYRKNGRLPDMIKENPIYGDFSDPKDYRESLEIVRFAEEQFMNLDASVRSRFDNDPAKFLEFTSDVNNIDEMVSLGLATKKEAPVVEKKEVVNA